MALQPGALRDALLDAGATADKADKAAEEIVGYDREFSDIRSDLRLLKWMVGTSVAISATVGVPAIYLLLKIAAKIGVLS